MKTRNNGLKALVILLALTLMLAVAGCDMFTSGGDKDKGSKWEAVKVADGITHEDPADLEFTERYVLTAEGDDDFIMALEDLDVLPVRAVVIIYGNDEKALVAYEYNVYENEEGAKAHVDYMATYGYDMKQEGKAAILYTDPEAMEANLISFNEWNIMSGEKAKDLADMFSSNFGLVLE